MSENFKKLTFTEKYLSYDKEKRISRLTLLVRIFLFFWLTEALFFVIDNFSIQIGWSSDTFTPYQIFYIVCVSLFMYYYFFKIQLIKRYQDFDSDWKFENYIGIFHLIIISTTAILLNLFTYFDVTSWNIELVDYIYNFFKFTAFIFITFLLLKKGTTWNNKYWEESDIRNTIEILNYK